MRFCREKKFAVASAIGVAMGAKWVRAAISVVAASNGVFVRWPNGE